MRAHTGAARDPDGRHGEENPGGRGGAHEPRLPHHRAHRRAHLARLGRSFAAVDEMRVIGKRFDLPLVANMVEKGRTPVLTRAELEAIGYRLAIFPVSALLAAVKAMGGVYSHIQKTGSSKDAPVPLEDFTELTRLMGFEDVWEFDKRHAE